jgi:hypothetical protein
LVKCGGYAINAAGGFVGMAGRYRFFPPPPPQFLVGLLSQTPQVNAAFLLSWRFSGQTRLLKRRRTGWACQADAWLAFQHPAALGWPTPRGMGFGT